MTYRLIALLLPLLFWTELPAQRIGIRTNLLYWATTTPNIGVEARVSGHVTASVSGGWNPFNYPNSGKSGLRDANPKLHHWLLVPEVKYWFCPAFERHFVSVYGLGGQFNAGGMRFPKFLDGTRYQGWAAGGGIGYGYQWAIGGRWGLEASVGVGYIHISYDRYACGACGTLSRRGSHDWFGPTKAEVSFIYYIK